MLGTKDKVIVIIACYNGQRYWQGLMPLLVEEKYHDFDLEILVVDNSSSDQSVEKLKNHYHQVKIIELKKNIGFVGANNKGFEYAKKHGADYIYLLNQDTVISPGFLQPLYNFAKSHKFGSLQSKLLLWSKKDIINTLGNTIHFLGFGYGTKSGETDSVKTNIKKINYSSGAGVFISVKVLEELGHLFDDSMFMYLEDLDLGWSLNMIGYDNYLVSESVIYHKYQFSRSMKHYYWFERNRLWTMFKNYKIPTIIIILPALIIMELGQLFYAIIHKRFWQKLKSYGFLLSLKKWYELSEKRKHIQSVRKRSDRQVVYKFSGRILFQPLDSIFLKIANVIFNIYWQIIKQFIFW